MVIAGCGGGSGGSSTPTSPGPTVLPATTPCHGTAVSDVFGTMVFMNRAVINVKPWGCVIASSTRGEPVFDGTMSARFEVRPEDCSSSLNYDDCANDRSRHEIEEPRPPAHPATAVIRYETRLYVPSQVQFRPAGPNLLFLTQIRFDTPSIGGTIAYLELGPNDELAIRTTVGPESRTNARYPAGKLVANRWFRVDWEVKASQTDGFIRAYVDGVKVAEELRATLPEPTGWAYLAFGIYNAFKSTASEPYATQVMYVDGLRKIIQ